MLHLLMSFIHIAVCVLMIFFILIQSNKGMGLSGAFGAVGAGENFLSTSGAFNILVKITTALALIFCILSVGLSYFPPPGGIKSILEDDKILVPKTLDELIKSGQNATPPSP